MASLSRGLDVHSSEVGKAGAMARAWLLLAEQAEKNSETFVVYEAPTPSREAMPCYYRRNRNLVYATLHSKIRLEIVAWVRQWQQGGI
jgi:hypothetical protein